MNNLLQDLASERELWWKFLLAFVFVLTTMGFLARSLLGKTIPTATCSRCHGEYDENWVVNVKTSHNPNQQGKILCRACCQACNVFVS